MGGTININLDKAVSTAINMPTLKGIPLYARIDGEMDAVGHGTKTPEWVEKSKRLYSSPDNIKRVFITYKGVYVEYYAPIKGSSNTSLFRETGYGDINTEEAIKSVLIGDGRYKITKTGLGGIIRPWVASNIEEIYFDGIVLLSSDIMNMGYGNLYNKYTNAKVDRLVDAEILREIFNYVCKGTGNINERFPRLRTIGFIQNLEQAYRSTPRISGTKSLSEKLAPWYCNGVVMQAVKDPNITVAIHNIEGTPKYNDRYSIKSGIYVYDAEVLEEYFTSLATRIRDYKKSIANKEIDAKKDKLEKKLEGTKSSFEITLDNLYESEGPEAAVIALKASMFNVSKEERNRVLSKMSAAGREKYKALLNKGGDK